MRDRFGRIGLLVLCVLGGIAGFAVSEGAVSVGSDYANQGVGYAAMFASAVLFVVVLKLRRRA